MAAYALDGKTEMKCPHGGKVTVKPKEQRVTLRDEAVFVMDDFSPPAPAISGCNFNISGSPSPCMQLKWLMPAQKVEIDGSPVLTSRSVGLCISAAQAPQGKAIVTGFQTEVEVK
jgi:hypothetical protein